MRWYCLILVSAYFTALGSALLYVVAAVLALGLLPGGLSARAGHDRPARRGQQTRRTDK